MSCSLSCSQIKLNVIVFNFIRLCECILLFTAGHPSSLPAIRSLGNITSGPSDWLSLILTSSIQGSISIIQVLNRSLAAGPSAHRAVLKESLWVMTNLLGGSEEQTALVTAQGGLTVVFDYLLCDQVFIILLLLYCM